MQNFSLGDYRGGANHMDSGMANVPTLAGSMQMAAGLAQQGMASQGQLHNIQAHDKASMAYALQNDELLRNRESLANQQKMAWEGGLVTGQENEMIAHNEELLGLLAPNDPLRTDLSSHIKGLRTRIGKGTLAERKGALDYQSARGIDDPFSQLQKYAAKAQVIKKEAEKSKKPQTDQKPSSRWTTI